MEYLSRLMHARVNQKRRHSEAAAKDLLLRNGFFDAQWYASQYSDVGMSGLDPLQHYLRIGSWLGRNPHPNFDAKWYMQRYPSILELGMDPAVHYLGWGRTEGRKIRRVGSKSPAFELSALRRFVDRKIQEWDAEREGEFLSRVHRLYEADLERFDRVPVTIVMPTYNRAYCIGDAIKSVQAQSHANWNLIVCDDGSDDDTSDVVARFRDPRITYVQGRRRGVSAARNMGLSRCRGEFVFYLDSDNSWLPGHIRTLLVFMLVGGLDAAYSAALCVSEPGGRPYVRGDDFDWAACLHQNFVDMNTFAHRASLIRQYGGFDESLRRLVDWDLILRYTRDKRSAFAPYIGVHYDDAPKPDRITVSEYRNGNQLEEAFDRIRAKHRGHVAHRLVTRSIRPMAEHIVSGIDLHHGDAEAPVEQGDVLRLGYVLWDWPALSQTFVLSELRTLVDRGIDVKVYYKVAADHAAQVDFPIEAHQVADADDLERLASTHGRNAFHSPFVYPAATLMTWPVAERMNIRFTLMAGGVDVAHYENMKRNRVGEMTASRLCAGVITLGSFHRDLLIECGVPSAKIAMERQTVDLPALVPTSATTTKARPRVLCVARFIEKKGIEFLIRAAASVPEVDVVIHGYGPLEGEYRRIIEELGVSNVQIAGLLSTRDELIGAYSSADAFVLPCVRAANGDLDGLPTVLLESMAAGVPVVTSAIANSPDLITDGVTGFLARPGDSDDLAQAMRRCIGMSEANRARLVAAARRRAVGYAGSDRTVDTLLTLWRRRKIDIVLVTYDVPGYENVAETLEIIRRIYTMTVMDFDLFVVDNNSSPAFKAALRDNFGANPNFYLIELAENIFCGPASNVGFGKGSSEYIVYICSKEGFILRHGWDLHMVRAMDAKPRAAMGGYSVELPRFRNGREIQEYPSFASWRGQDFAARNPERRFRHVQGGVYILRRDVFERSGGFSKDVVHNGMDVEYSYYLESLGYELVDITGVYAVTTKTLPPLLSLVDEHAYLIHPSTIAGVGTLDRIARRETRYCNLCGWEGDTFDAAGSGVEVCPSCRSNAFDRTVYRVLSQSGYLQTRPPLRGFVETGALASALSRLCPQQRLVPLQKGGPISLADAFVDAPAGSVVVVDHVAWGNAGGEASEIARLIGEHVSTGGMVLLGEPDGYDEAPETLFARGVAAGVAHQSVTLISDCCRFDTRPIHLLSSAIVAADLQGLDA